MSNLTLKDADRFNKSTVDAVKSAAAFPALAPFLILVSILVCFIADGGFILAGIILFVTVLGSINGYKAQQYLKLKQFLMDDFNTAVKNNENFKEIVDRLVKMGEE
jgi:hypothetical protein